MSWTHRFNLGGGVFGQYGIRSDELHADQVAVICPHCQIDSVIGSASGFPISKDFLTEMNEHWFGT